MPTFSRGDVVRVPFPYTDKSTRQHRPALVVSDGTVGEAGRLLWVVMITSAANASWPGDCDLSGQYREAGLPIPSVVRPTKIATIEASDARKLGQISESALVDVVSTISRALGR